MAGCSLASQLQALHLSLRWQQLPDSSLWSRAQPRHRGGLGHTLLRHQDSQSSASLCHAAYIASSSGNVASGDQWNRGGGGGGGGGGSTAVTTALDTSSGSLAWQTVASALDQRKLDVALQECSYLLDQGGQPPSELCNRLLSGEAADCQRAWFRPPLLLSCILHHTKAPLISPPHLSTLPPIPTCSPVWCAALP